MSTSMLLLLTNSANGTSDAIVDALGSEVLFRFNLDQWGDYSVSLNRDGFIMVDPTGRRIEEHQVTKLFVRKPHFFEDSVYSEGGNLDHYSREQVQYVVNEIYNLFAESNRVCLVEKRAEARFGKVLQMRLAQQFFVVPDWEIFWGQTKEAGEQEWIAKTLKAVFTANSKFLYARPVDRSRLDPRYPWFTQHRVEASHDVTVAYVAGQCFAYELDRTAFVGDDWRTSINERELPWSPVALPPYIAKGVGEFMASAKLQFGRLDFLRNGAEWFFLEVNPNGQWLWLDLDGSSGLFQAVISHLRNDLDLAIGGRSADLSPPATTTDPVVSA